MPYLLLTLALAGFGVGFGTAHQIDKAARQHMESALQLQKTEAQALLFAAQSHIAESEKASILANQQLDKSHESAINSINALHDSFAAVRLRDPGRRQGGDCPVSTGANPGQPEAKTDSAELSAELARFLVDQAYQADRVAEYARHSYAFVVERQCGILASPDKLLTIAN